jgi:hypothetical protein
LAVKAKKGGGVSKSRGNKTSKAERVERQSRAVALMNEGKSQTQIAQELGISRMTFWRDLQAIEARYVEGSQEDVAQFKKAQYQALLQIENAIAEGTIPADVGNALTKVRAEVAKLLGLNAPTKSISHNVNVEQQVIPIEQQLEYLNAFAGLYEDERLEELDRVKARKRTCRVTITADGWGTPKQLEESCGS